MAARATAQGAHQRPSEQMSGQLDPRKHPSGAQGRDQVPQMFHQVSFIKEQSTTGPQPPINSSHGKQYQQPYSNPGMMPQRMPNSGSQYQNPPGNMNMHPSGSQRMMPQTHGYPPGHPPSGYNGGMPAPLGMGSHQPSIGGPHQPPRYQNPPPHGGQHPHQNNPYSAPAMPSPHQGKVMQGPPPGQGSSGMSKKNAQENSQQPSSTRKDQGGGGGMLDPHQALPLTKNASIAPPTQGYIPQGQYGHPPPHSVQPHRSGGPSPHHPQHPYAQRAQGNQPLRGGPPGAGYQDPNAAQSLRTQQQASLMPQKPNYAASSTTGATVNSSTTQATTSRSNNRSSANDVPKYQEPKIQNLVSTANLNHNLDLLKIGNHCRNAQYNPKRFAALIMRLKEPTRTTALIFKNGKMVITGAKSEMDSEQAAKQYTRAIRQVGNPVKLTEFKIQNMVASCSVSFKIKLEQLYHSDHRTFCDFNPETFPGLIYHLNEPKVCLLIFASGKIVLTGAKTREDIRIAFTKIQPLLKQHIKKDHLREDAANQQSKTAAAQLSSRRGGQQGHV